MARLIVRLAALCLPQRSIGAVLSKPFRMMRLGDDAATPCGPGWYESSRDLEFGLMVREGGPGDALFNEWHEACRRVAALPPKHLH